MVLKVHVYLIIIYLTLVALSNVVCTISLYGKPEVPRSLHYPCHPMTIGMGGIDPLIDLFQYLFNVIFIQIESREMTYHIGFPHLSKN